MNSLSVVYEAQGSKSMGIAMKAAAREAWIGVWAARGRTASSEGNNAVPSAGDFEKEVETRYR